MKKHIIVINGQGGCGKDTICEIVGKHYTIINISSIDPIKRAANYLGWDNVKNDKSRKFLHELKMLSTWYNDYSMQYILGEINFFLNMSMHKIMFIHMREPKEIDRLKSLCDYNIETLLIKRGDDRVFGNEADDEVNNYTYDYVYMNDKSLDELDEDFIRWFRENIKD